MSGTRAKRELDGTQPNASDLMHTAIFFRAILDPLPV